MVKRRRRKASAKGKRARARWSRKGKGWVCRDGKGGKAIAMKFCKGKKRKK